MRRALALLCAVVVAVGLVVSGYVLSTSTRDNAETSAKASAKAEVARTVAQQAKRFASQIQAERARNVLDGCEQLNRRFDNTVKALDDLIRKAPPSNKARAKRSRDGTVFLIRALVPPHKDKHGRSTCAALVHRQVSGG